MKTEIEQAREDIKEYRKGYGQPQLPTDCIIQLMMGHADKQLNLARVSKHRELLIAYELENWEGSDVLLEAVEARVDQYLSNL